MSRRGRLDFGQYRHRPTRPKPHVFSYTPPEGGTPISRSFDDFDAGTLWLAEQRVMLERRGYIAVNAHQVTVGGYWERFLLDASKRVKANTWEKYEITGRLHILPTFGHRTLVSVRRYDMQAWVDALPLAPSAAANAHGIFSVMWNAAIADELISRSPAYKVKPPRVIKRRAHIPTSSEVQAIREAIYPRFAIMVTLASEAGLRKGEILGLREDAIDLDRGYLDVIGQAQTLKGGVELDLSTKSAAGYRRIPLDTSTADAIVRHLEVHGHRSGVVVTTQTGRPVRANHAHDHWVKACDRAGVHNLRLHDLRHFFAAGLVAHGIDPKRVQTLMGHASISETLDTYGHLWPNGDDKVRAAIAAMRRDTP